MGSLGESQLASLRKHIANLEPYRGQNNEVQTALIYDMDKVREIEGVLKELERKRKVPLEEVKEVFLDRIYTSQPFLYKDKLEDYADEPIHKLATGYMYQGDVIVIDGNHRLTLAKLNNQTKVRMKIINLDKPKK